MTATRRRLDTDLLGIYLNDHLAGATGGVELAERAAENNRDSPLGDFLRRLKEELVDDREAVQALMERLDVKRNPAKAAAGWVAEKAGRLKTNANLTSYSPLSRLIELEGLMAGSNARYSMFLVLEEMLPDPDAAKDFGERAKQADRQIARLREHWERAMRDAFSEVCAA
jgi:hypothetical protein